MLPDKAERNRIAMRKWRRNHREEHRAEVAHWAKTHPEWRRNIVRKSQKKRLRELRSQVLSHYGGNPPKCACCGEEHIEFLTIDHIKSIGMRERERLGYRGRGRGFYHWLIDKNFPEGYQILCMNCNWAKRIDGVCPHVQNNKVKL